jgi:ligand-binding SRPBCC domain-containing protein
MALIHLTTFIKAPCERVFDLSRSITLHKMGMQAFQETVIAGRSSGLLELHEIITWSAKHLGKMRQLTLRMTDLKFPEFFCNNQVSGDFKFMAHEHHFKAIQNGTILIDLLDYSLPYGWIGQMVDKWYLTNYMRNLLVSRNRIIKEYAETDKWRLILE